jgi:Protein of unknown function (DUF2752)
MVMFPAIAALSSWLGSALPVCPLRSLTGVACPACGGTRALLALVRGDLAGAMAWNPFVILGIAGLLTAGIASVVAPSTAGRWLARAGAEARTRRGRWLLFLGLAGAGAWQTAHL